MSTSKFGASHDDSMTVEDDWSRPTTADETRNDSANEHSGFEDESSGKGSGSEAKHQDPKTEAAADDVVGNETIHLTAESANTDNDDTAAATTERVDKQPGDETMVESDPSKTNATAAVRMQVDLAAQRGSESPGAENSEPVHAVVGADESPSAGADPGLSSNETLESTAEDTTTDRGTDNTNVPQSDRPSTSEITLARAALSTPLKTSKAYAAALDGVVADEDRTADDTATDGGTDNTNMPRSDRPSTSEITLARAALSTPLKTSKAYAAALDGVVADEDSTAEDIATDGGTDNTNMPRSDRPSTSEITLARAALSTPLKTSKAYAAALDGVVADEDRQGPRQGSELGELDQPIENIDEVQTQENPHGEESVQDTELASGQPSAASTTPSTATHERDNEEQQISSRTTSPREQQQQQQGAVADTGADSSDKSGSGSKAAETVPSQPDDKVSGSSSTLDNESCNNPNPDPDRPGTAQLAIARASLSTPHRSEAYNNAIAGLVQEEESSTGGGQEASVPDAGPGDEESISVGADEPSAGLYVQNNNAEHELLQILHAMEAEASGSDLDGGDDLVTSPSGSGAVGQSSEPKQEYKHGVDALDATAFDTDSEEESVELDNEEMLRDENGLFVFNRAAQVAVFQVMDRFDEGRLNAWEVHKRLPETCKALEVACPPAVADFWRNLDVDSDELYGPRSFVAENERAAERAQYAPTSSLLSFADDAIMSREDCALLFAHLHNKALQVQQLEGEPPLPDDHVESYQVLHALHVPKRTIEKFLQQTAASLGIHIPIAADELLLYAEDEEDEEADASIGGEENRTESHITAAEVSGKPDNENCSQDGAQSMGTDEKATVDAKPTDELSAEELSLARASLSTPLAKKSAAYSEALDGIVVAGDGTSTGNGDDNADQPQPGSQDEGSTRPTTAELSLARVSLSTPLAQKSAAYATALNSESAEEERRADEQRTTAAGEQHGTKKQAQGDQVASDLRQSQLSYPQFERMIAALPSVAESKAKSNNPEPRFLKGEEYREVMYVKESVADIYLGLFATVFLDFLRVDCAVSTVIVLRKCFFVPTGPVFTFIPQVHGQIL